MENITHQAKIINIKGHTITLKLMPNDACHSCAANNFCNLSKHGRERVININDANSANFQIGEEVDVCISLRNGIKAVVYAYIIPLLLLLGAVIICKTIGLNDFKSGISGIIVLIPYYFVLFLMKNKFNSGLTFKITEHTTDE